MFTTDSRTENFLTSMGVKFEYTNGVMLPGDFVAEWNKENIGRPVAVREDAVIEYAALMEQGSAAPAPILHSTATGMRVLDGVQRISAAELNRTTRISAYVVYSTSADTLAAVRVLANARMQGRAEAPEWTRRRAVEVLVVERGLTCAEVSRMGGWKPADVQRIADAIALQRRITNVGGPDLPDMMLSELAPHLQGDVLAQAIEPVTGFLHTLKQSRMSAADAGPYISTFFERVPKADSVFKTLSARLELMHGDAEIKSRLTGRQSVAITRDVVLLKELKGAVTVLDEILAHGDRVVNVDEFFRLIDRIKEKLMKLSSHKPPQTARVPADLWSNNK